MKSLEPARTARGRIHRSRPMPLQGILLRGADRRESLYSLAATLWLGVRTVTLLPATAGRHLSETRRSPLWWPVRGATISSPLSLPSAARRYLRNLLDRKKAIQRKSRRALRRRLLLSAAGPARLRFRRVRKGSDFRIAGAPIQPCNFCRPLQSYVAVPQIFLFSPLLNRLLFNLSI